MNIKYIGLKAINGPLIVLEGVSGISNEEMVNIELQNGQKRTGRVVMLEGDKAVIQVFEGTTQLSLSNTRINFSGKPMQLNVSSEILGRVFSGVGKAIDGLGEILPAMSLDINGSALNPVSRVYPKNYINTGISSIDGLITLIRGQKLPIFSGSGLPHNEIAVQIVKQANLSKEESKDFCIVFAAMGVKNDVADYFIQEFKRSGVMNLVSMYVNLASDPIIERILTPRVALTAAEYLAFTLNKHVLVILTDMTSYCEALREFSSSKGEIPGRKGFPVYLYSDLSSIYERAGIIKSAKGSITQIPILSMPNDDITHPVPDLTGYITEGQIVLDRELHQKGIYPPIGILPSLSRLMKDGIGDGFTRSDHQALSTQLFASYAKVTDVRSLASIIGEDELNEIDKQYIKFGELFEDEFIGQGNQVNRTIEETLDLGWDLLSLLSISELNRLDDDILSKYYNKKKAYERFRITSTSIIDDITR